MTRPPLNHPSLPPRLQLSTSRFTFRNLGDRGISDGIPVGVTSGKNDCINRDSSFPLTGLGQLPRAHRRGGIMEERLAGNRSPATSACAWRSRRAARWRVVGEKARAVPRRPAQGCYYRTHA